MRSFSTIFFLLLAYFLCGASSNPNPKPEPIYSITRVVYSVDYYIVQANLWKLEIQQDKQNAWAWLNYYEATRYANLFSADEKPFDMEKVYKDLSNNIPNTYEYHLITYEKSGGDTSLIGHLEKAYELAPERYDTYPNFMFQYELSRQTDLAKVYAQKWFESGEYSSGVLSWNYNVLMSLEKNAILVTHGDNDTYPIWILQYAKNIRTDVTVLNAHLLLKDDYRNLVFREFDIAPFTKSKTDYDDGKDYANYYNAVASHVVKNAKRPVYLSTTVSTDLRNQYSDHLYWVGLAFKHSPQQFDNVAVLKNNFENRFLTDYMKIDLNNDISNEVVSQMNMHYIPPFLLLHEHYTVSGELVKANDLKDLTLKIAKAGGKEKQVQSMMEEEANAKKRAASNISTKYYDKTMMHIKGNLYAQDTELINEDYEVFLMDLLKHREFELLEKCKIHKTDWRALLPEQHRNLPDEVIFLNGLPNDPHLPVKNISYQAAKEYCKWLTAAYNHSDKKKKYQEVKFRLPTEAEWEYAARGGRNLAPYPWGGYYCQNAKKCYLSNFYVSEEAPCEDCEYNTPSNDGGFFVVNANAYFPNDYGLYGMSGNVAEMVQEESIAKGGSWEDVPEECTITFKKEYEKPSPAIGFRIFMEVIKE